MVGKSNKLKSSDSPKKKKNQSKVRDNSKDPVERYSGGKGYSNKSKNSAGETALSKGNPKDPPVHYKRKKK